MRYELKSNLQSDKNVHCQRSNTITKDWNQASKKREYSDEQKNNEWKQECWIFLKLLMSSVMTHWRRLHEKNNIDRFVDYNEYSLDVLLILAFLDSYMLFSYLVVVRWSHSVVFKEIERLENRDSKSISIS